MCPGSWSWRPPRPLEAYGLAEKRHPAWRSGAVHRAQAALYPEGGRCPRMPSCRASGKARVARAGNDVTLIAYSAMVRNALEAADELARSGISVEVIDLRTLLPLDMATIAASVAKTHRVVIAHEAVQNGGWARRSRRALAVNCSMSWTRPVTRVGCPFAPIPFAPDLERALLPGTREYRACRARIGRLSLGGRSQESKSGFGRTGNSEGRAGDGERPARPLAEERRGGRETGRAVARSSRRRSPSLKSNPRRAGGWWSFCCRWTRRRGSAIGLPGWKMMPWRRQRCRRYPTRVTASLPAASACADVREPP